MNNLSDLPCPFCGGDPKDMPPDIAIFHVNEAIAKALRGESYIDASVLDIGGFSTATMRRLFSNLVHLPKSNPTYMECGLFKGATVCAAMNNSPTLHVYGVENFSQPFDQTDVQEELERNIATYRNGAQSVTIFDTDCFELDLSLIKHPVDVLFLDMEHSFIAQKEAVTHLVSVLSDVAIIVVDDSDWLPVKEGTAAGFDEIKDRVTIERHWHLSEGQPDSPIWHNGLDLFCVSRLRPTVQQTAPAE